MRKMEKFLNFFIIIIIIIIIIGEFSLKVVSF
jgi:hypothetical protein